MGHFGLVFTVVMRSGKHTVQINVVLLLSLAVSAEMHCDLCLGVLLRRAGGVDFLGGGHLGRGRRRDH